MIYRRQYVIRTSYGRGPGSSVIRSSGRLPFPILTNSTPLALRPVRQKRFATVPNTSRLSASFAVCVRRARAFKQNNLENSRIRQSLCVFYRR